MTPNWLPLTEYSSKHKVSISTLRRRIKTDDIKFTFADGKYLIMDEPVDTHQRIHRPSQESVPAQAADTRSSSSFQIFEKPEAPTAAAASHEPLLEEIRKAYSLILHEKEEQILILKEEISDLKTLVRVLESEVARHSGQNISDI